MVVTISLKKNQIHYITSLITPNQILNSLFFIVKLHKKRLCFAPFQGVKLKVCKNCEFKGYIFVKCFKIRRIYIY